ncbi:MAG: dethiobiotin synthase, partial [Pseudomonadota bacterium]|nr:dethiobiotin synthase [Pseudomonadota bacterium]
GGVMVPLNETDTTLDWQAALNARCFLVTGSYLGTLSHTMTALEALKERGITPSAIIINSSEFAPVPEQETAETLGRYVTDIPIHIVARNADTLPEELVLTL